MKQTSHLHCRYGFKKRSYLFLLAYAPPNLQLDSYHLSMCVWSGSPSLPELPSVMLIIDEYKDFYFSLQLHIWSLFIRVLHNYSKVCRCWFCERDFVVHCLYKFTSCIFLSESDVIATANLMANISLSFLTW